MGLNTFTIGAWGWHGIAYVGPALVLAFLFLLAGGLGWRAAGRWACRLHPHAQPQQAARLQRRRLLLRLAGLACWLLALLGPARTGGPATAEETHLVRPVLLVVDVSRSMRARDVPPDRLTWTRHAVQQLMEQHPRNRYALVVFAGDAWFRVPFTYDRGFLHETLQAIDPAEVSPQGTDFARLFALIEQTAVDWELTSLDVVLLSDGELQAREDPMPLVRVLAQRGIRLHTVAVGGNSPAPVPGTDGYLEREDGSIAYSRPDRIFLARIAEETGGRFWQADSARALDLDPLLGAISAAWSEQGVAGAGPDHGQRLAWLGWLLLWASLLTWTGRPRPRFSGALRRLLRIPAATGLLIVLAGCPAQDEGERLAALGRDALDREQPLRARQAFAAAARLPADPVIRSARLHDAGTAAARGGDLPAAAGFYLQALATAPHPETEADLAWVLARLAELQEQAAEASDSAGEDPDPQEEAGDASDESPGSAQDGPDPFDDSDAGAGRDDEAGNDAEQSAREDAQDGGDDASGATQFERAEGEDAERAVGVLLERRVMDLQEGERAPLRSNRRPGGAAW